MKAYLAVIFDCGDEHVYDVTSAVVAAVARKFEAGEVVRITTSPTQKYTIVSGEVIDGRIELERASGSRFHVPVAAVHRDGDPR